MNFECPYCHHHTTITQPNRYSSWKKINISPSKKWENIWFNIVCITCPNKECNELYLVGSLTEANSVGFNNWERGDVIKERNLLPESEAKVLPDYIPEAIKNDYYEACRIRNLSPKASATLARRCLQWMIRNYWKITKWRLIDEIIALEEFVEPEVWDAIDSVRKIWNIGAHMEKDIDYIIDVDENEAQAHLKGVLEWLKPSLFVRMHERGIWMRLCSRKETIIFLTCSVKATISRGCVSKRRSCSMRFAWWRFPNREELNSRKLNGLLHLGPMILSFTRPKKPV